ncbi:unnamed protein product [Musa textilis]
MDYFSEHLRRCYTSCRPPLPGSTASKSGPDATQHHQNHHHRKIITSDPYVTASLAGATVARTRVISNSEDPAWNEHFNIPVAHRASTLELQVKDNDVFGAQLIGIVSIPTARIAAGKKIQDWFPIIGPRGKPPKPETALRLSIEYIPVEEKPEYQHGIAGDPEQLGVRNAYFPLRKGGSVTLYQDAHVRYDELPEVTLEKGAIFKHEKCWEDICHAILEAHHLIYLVGWSIYHKVKLVREPSRPLPDASKLTLGELLKYKSQEGVRVCMLVWDDKTSHDRLFIKTGGVMQTHDEETKKFFKHSSVICVLSPRYASSKLSIVKQQAGIKAPRQPWHDLHCKIEGPAVYDILKNFEQRWRKATRWREFSLCLKNPSGWHDDALIRLERISWILSPSPSVPDDDPSLWVSQQEDSEQWHIQVFRSIDSGSVKGFPDNVQEASKMNLVCRKESGN